MAFWLRSEERRVAARGQRVRADLSALQDARESLAAGLRYELGRPKVLLACFAAGFGFGWLRRRTARPAREGEEADVAQQSGRLAKLAAAVIAGARIYDQLKRAAAFVERQGYWVPEAPGAASSSPGSTVSRRNASDEPRQRERTEADARAAAADQDAFSCS